MSSPATNPDIADHMAALSVPFEADVPLGPLTWYGIGGSAALLARPTTTDQLAAIVRFGTEHGVPVRVLGKGANLLVADGTVDGVVLVLDADHFRRVEIDESTGRVTAGAGADLERTITATVRAGLSGLEVLAGIPATIGGALCMNAGGAFGEIGPRVSSVTVIEPDGTLTTLERDDLAFDYRRSNLAGRFITSAEFALAPVDDQPALRERLKEVMRYKKNSQPMAESSAGCAFKNPRSQSEHGAGKLIDMAGLKGTRVGGAEVSGVHANFIVVHDGATADDVLRLIDQITATVHARFGITLEREVVVWNG